MSSSMREVSISSAGGADEAKGSQAGAVSSVKGGGGGGGEEDDDIDETDPLWKVWKQVVFVFAGIE